MGSGQYKRIYNIVFVLLVICTCVFVYGASKDFVSRVVYNAREDYQQRVSQESPFDQARHDDLVKQGKIKAAEDMANEGDRKALRYIAEDKRISWCEENTGTLATIPMILAYVAAYFLIWYSVFFCVRYVKAGKNQMS
jgi:hypothetical protein